MFTINDLFSQCFPMLKGISFDVGTAMTGMLVLFFILIGLEYLKNIFSRSFCSKRENQFLAISDKYFEDAKAYSKGSAKYRQQMALGNYYVRKSVNSHLSK